MQCSGEVVKAPTPQYSYAIFFGVKMRFGLPLENFYLLHLKIFLLLLLLNLQPQGVAKKKKSEATSLLPKPIALAGELSDVTRDGAVVGDAQEVVIVCITTTGSCNDDRPSSPSPTCTQEVEVAHWELGRRAGGCLRRRHYLVVGSILRLVCLCLKKIKIKNLQRMKREEKEDEVWNPIQIAFFNLLNR